MLPVPVTARLYPKFFNEVIITDKHELFVGMMAFGLASCKDDKLIPDIDEPEVNIPIPTEDEVKTTVGKNYTVLGEQFDGVPPYVMKRMTGMRYDHTSYHRPAAHACYIYVTFYI